MAVVIETLKCRSTSPCCTHADNSIDSIYTDKPSILDLLTIVDLLKLEKKVFPAQVPSGAPSSKNLVLVLLQDLLFSKDCRIHASDKWPPKAAISRHQTRFKAELVKLQIRKRVKSKQELVREGGEVAGESPGLLIQGLECLATHFVCIIFAQRKFPVMFDATPISFPHPISSPT